MASSAAARSGVARGQLALVAAAAVSMACALALSVIVARSAGAVEFGFFALVATVLPIGRDMIDLGTANVAARRIARFPDEENATVARLLAWRRTPAAIVAASLVLLSWLQPDTVHRLVLLGAALCALAYVNTGFFALLQARQRLDIAAAITVATQVATLLAVIILAVISAPAIFFPLAVIVREAASSLILRRVAIGAFGYAARPGPAKSQSQLRFGELGSMTVASLAYQLSVVSGLVLVSLLSAPAELGWYGAAFRLGAPLVALPWVIAAPLVPDVARGHGGEGCRLSGDTSRHFEFPLVVGGVAAGFGIAAAGPLIQLLFGDSFAAAAPAFRAIMVAVAANAAIAFAVTGLVAIGADRLVLRIAIANLVATVALSLFLVPARGALGAAEALAIALGVNCAMVLAAALGVLRAGTLAVKVIGTGAIVAVVAMLVPHEGVAQVAVAALISVAVLAAAFVLPAKGNG
jgi:O-antigen/teichoic acid export membrane protein